MHKINRRSFLKVCGIAAGAMALAACGKKEVTPAPASSAAVSAATSGNAASTAAVEATKTYTLVNAMDADVTELYVYKTGSAEKGDNLATTAMKKGDTVDVDVTGFMDGENKTKYTIDFTADGKNYKFETLSVEDLPSTISLIGPDNTTGATPIRFDEAAESAVSAPAESAPASSAAAVSEVEKAISSVVTK